MSKDSKARPKSQNHFRMIGGCRSITHYSPLGRQTTRSSLDIADGGAALVPTTSTGPLPSNNPISKALLGFLRLAPQRSIPGTVSLPAGSPGGAVKRGPTCKTTPKQLNELEGSTMLQPASENKPEINGTDLGKELQQLHERLAETAHELEHALADSDKDPSNAFLQKKALELMKKQLKMFEERNRLLTEESAYLATRPLHEAGQPMTPEVESGLRELAAAVLEADLEGEVIRLPILQASTLPACLRSSIYIRKSYSEALARIAALKRGTSLVLTGNPGIGKSAFVVMLLCYLAQHHQRMIVCTNHSTRGASATFLDFTDPANILLDHGVETDGSLKRVESKMGESIWVLVDGRVPSRQADLEKDRMVICSLDQEKDAEIIKGQANFDLLWMDPWTFDELDACRALLYPQVSRDTAKERFIVFGGAVRYVLTMLNFSKEDLTPLQL